MSKLTNNEIALQLLLAQFESQKDLFGRMTTYSSFILFGVLGIISADLLLAFDIKPNGFVVIAIIALAFSIAFSGSAMYKVIYRQHKAITLFNEGNSPKKILKALHTEKELPSSLLTWPMWAFYIGMMAILAWVFIQ